MDLVVLGGPNRRIRVDEDRGGGCVEARSHPGELLALVVRSLKDRSRRPRVLTMRCIVVPQKQVGSARFGAEPIIRKRISAPQDRFGHSHHSSRLFFTNATSARFNAPRRCTCSLRAPSPCRVDLPTEGCVSTKIVHQNGSLPVIWLSVIREPRKKMLSAHDYDRASRGWFPSQIPRFVRRRGTTSIGSCSTSIFNPVRCFFRCEEPEVELCFGSKNSRI